MRVAVAPHPWLDLALFTTRFALPLGAQPSPPELLALFVPDAAAPLASGDAVRGAVRDLLRHSGFKPTGRSKPASEYLSRALGEGSLGSKNRAVDACNAVSLHSGLPVSVIDCERASEPLFVAPASAGTRYVFNPSGQELDAGGLLCLHDAAGPCASPVKDAQRTKTTADTTFTLSLVWGTNALPGRTAAAVAWYRALVVACGGEVGDVELVVR